MSELAEHMIMIMTPVPTGLLIYSIIDVSIRISLLLLNIITELFFGPASAPQLVIKNCGMCCAVLQESIYNLHTQYCTV